MDAQLRDALVLVKYPGGKYALIPWIYRWFPDHRFYVEPFGGMLTVYLNVRNVDPKNLILNDVSPMVVNVWRVMAAPDLARDLARRLREQSNSDEDEHVVRRILGSLRHHDRPSVEAAYAVLAGYSCAYFGILGHRASRGTAVPFSYRTAALISAKLRRAVLMCRDWRAVARDYDREGYFFYLDPPYYESTNQYGSTWTEDDFHDLVQWMREAKARVLLSHYQHPYLDALGFERRTRVRMRKMGSAARKVEAVYANYSLSETLAERRLARFWLFHPNNRRHLEHLFQSGWHALKEGLDMERASAEDCDVERVF